MKKEVRPNAKSFVSPMRYAHCTCALHNVHKELTEETCDSKYLHHTYGKWGSGEGRGRELVVEEVVGFSEEGNRISEGVGGGGGKCPFWWRVERELVKEWLVVEG